VLDRPTGSQHAGVEGNILTFFHQAFGFSRQALARIALTPSGLTPVDFKTFPRSGRSPWSLSNDDRLLSLARKALKLSENGSKVPVELFDQFLRALPKCAEQKRPGEIRTDLILSRGAAISRSRAR
jgi:hypothetical protein